MRSKNGVTSLTVPPAPYLIVPFLPTAVSDVSFATTIYTIHASFLSFLLGKVPQVSDLFRTRR